MTFYGATVPTTGWPALNTFEANTGVPIQLVRCYPGPRSLSDSISVVSKSYSLFPRAAICFNPKIAGKNYTLDQMRTFAAGIEVTAAKVPAFWLVPDAEPDRKDRTYTDAQFMEAFALMADAVRDAAPHVTMSLNLTGYDFQNRIGRYRAIKPKYKVLSLDPYWTAAPNGVQGTTRDLDVAAYWAMMNRKQLALAEWGAEVGPGQEQRLKAGLDWIAAHNVLFSGYYIESNPAAAPIICNLTTPAAFETYRAATTR